MPGVTAGDAFERQPETFEDTVFLECFLRVVRAGRIKTAGGGQDDREGELIEADERLKKSHAGAAGE